MKNAKDLEWSFDLENQKVMDFGLVKVDCRLVEDCGSKILWECAFQHSWVSVCRSPNWHGRQHCMFEAWEESKFRLKIVSDLKFGDEIWTRQSENAGWSYLSACGHPGQRHEGDHRQRPVSTCHAFLHENWPCGWALRDCLPWKTWVIRCSCVLGIILDVDVFWV